MSQWVEYVLFVVVITLRGMYNGFCLFRLRLPTDTQGKKKVTLVYFNSALFHAFSLKMTQNQLWIVYPSLKKQIVQENQPVYFCCREVAPCVVIELWSNVCINKTWHGRALTKRGKEHQLMLLPPPGDYEYTFRFKETMDLDWSWYGDYNQNFQLSITTCSQVPSVPNTLCVVAEEHHNEVDLWHFKTQHSSTCSFLCVGPFNPQSFVSSIKKG